MSNEGSDPDSGEADADTEPADSTEGGADTEPVDPIGSGAGDAATRTPGPDEQYCPNCGEIILEKAEICPECGVRKSPPGGDVDGSNDRVTAGVLAILLGWAGVHKFYLGDTGLGVLYLCFFWTGIPAIVGLIEGILYLTKTDAEFQEKYVD
jgi:hypothetical protein